MGLNNKQIEVIASEVKKKLYDIRTKENKVNRDKALETFKKSKNYKLFIDYHKTFKIKIQDSLLDKVINYNPKPVYIYLEDIERQIVLSTIDKDLKVDDLIKSLITKFK